MEKNNEPSGFQKFLINAVGFFRRLIDSIKKADRRLVIMIGAAVVLLILIICLIAHGVSASSDGAVVVNEPETVSESETDSNIISNGNVSSGSVASASAGTYVVTTGSDETNLNMRIAADKSSSKLTEIPNGTQLEVLYVDEYEDNLVDGEGWGYVEYDGQRGWVAMSCLDAA
ncbi:MAG: SH3 domain-containing protein [Clostridiales bacterium]|nr:SH3 domain-containing protein [Clostridiales bacterium]